MSLNQPSHIEWRDSSLFAAPAGNLGEVKRITERYGFCVVKGVFGPDDLAKLVDGMRASPLKQPGAAEPDLLSLPHLRWLLTDDRVLSIARRLLGPQLVYYGETAANFEEEIGKYTLKPLMKLHADATGTPANLLESWHPPVGRADYLYPVYRFAVYLQDYSQHSGGLKVVPESHLVDHDTLTLDETQKRFVQLTPEIAAKIASRNYGYHNVTSQPGDLVIWNLHTRHSAGALRLVADTGLALPPEVEKQLWLKQSKLYHPAPGPRIAAFFDYGRESEEVDLYIKSRAIMRASAGKSPSYKSWIYDDFSLSRSMAVRDVTLRFDAIIVSLGLALMNAYNSSGGDASILLSPQFADLSARLVALCRANKEFSAYFTLVNHTALLTSAIDTNQVMMLLTGIRAFGIESGLITKK